MDSTQGAGAVQAFAINNGMLKNLAKWSKLTQACIQAKTNLEASLLDLGNNCFKAYLLNEQKDVVQAHIQEGLEQVQIIHDAAQALCKENTLDNLQNLQAAMNSLESIRSAALPLSTTETPLETPTQDGVIASIWQEVKEFLSPVAFAGWGLLAQSGIFSREVAQQMPFIGSFISFFWTLKNRMDVRIEHAKTADIKQLIQSYDLLMEIFMSTGNSIDFAAKIRATNEALTRTLEANHAQGNRNIAEIRLANGEMMEKFTEVLKNNTEFKVEMRAEMAELKQHILLLLKNQQNTQPSSGSKIPDNHA